MSTQKEKTPIRKEVVAVFMSLIILALLIFLSPSAAFTLSGIAASLTPGGTPATSFTAGTTFYVTVNLTKMSDEALNNVTAIATASGVTPVNETNYTCASDLNGMYGYNGSGYGYGSSGHNYGYGNYSYGSFGDQGAGYGYGYGYGYNATPAISCTFAFTLSTPGTYSVDVYANGNMVNASATTITVSAPGGSSSSSSSSTTNTTTCTPEWNTCTGWSTCSATGVMIRQCYDDNNCGVSTGEPDTVEPCTPPTTCVESWSCTDYSTCSEAGYQTRTCTDSNNCGTTLQKPAEFQTCTYTTSLPPAIIATATESGATAAIPTAAAGTTQTVNLPSQATASTGVMSILLYTNNTLTNATLTVNALTVKPADVNAPNGTVIVYLNLSAQGINGNIDHAIINFQLSKSQVSDTSKVELAHYVNGDWVMLPTTYTGETSTDYTFQATTSGFSYFAVVEAAAVITPITAVPTAVSTTTTVANTSNIWVYLLVILIVIVAAYWWYIHKKPKYGKR